MGSSLVIVAIPEEQDRVWKISSEKVPHLTLLYLGPDVDQIANVDQIMQFVDHAVTLSEHGPFYLDVDSRGKLGEDEADVLFFNKRSWNLKWVRQFRGQLLQNQAIRTAYDSTPQHTAPQDWLPHLTLGYPDAPAKELPNDGFDHPFYSVCFDRIAVWAEDSNGPEFKLEWPDRVLEGDLAVAYSDTQKAALMHTGRLEAPVITQTATERGAEFLEHYGKKGMKWGVRNDRQGRDRFKVEGHSLEGDVARAALLPLGTNAPALVRLGKRYGGHRAEKKWEKGLRKNRNYAKFHNQVSDEVNKKLPDLNNDSRWKGKDLTKDPKLEKQYMDEFHNVLYTARHQAVKDVFGMNSPSGKKMVVPVHGDDRLIIVRVKKNEVEHGDGEAKHADTEETTDILFQVTRDEQGFVTNLEHVNDTDNAGDNAEHTDLGNAIALGETFVNALVHGQTETETLGEEFLAHYGKKGMKWGVRNTSRSTSTPTGLFSREPPKAVAPTATSKVPHGSRRKTKVETEGGENHPAHEDAIKVAKSAAKLKKSGTKALSNTELRDLAERIRLEAQATELTRSSGSKWIRKFLGNQGNQAANQIVRTEVDSRIRSARTK